MVATFQPRTVAQVLDILRQPQPAVLLAGGTDLMIRRRNWSGLPPRFTEPVVLLNQVAELQTIAVGNERLTIGAGVTLRAIAEHPLAPEVLRQAVRLMASPAIRNRATLGGNICNASPAADTLPPLYVLGASVVLRSAVEELVFVLPIQDFILGPGRIALASNELLTAIEIPLAPTRYQTQYYQKVGTRKADALAKVSIAALAEQRGGRLIDLRIACGAVAPRVVRDAALEGRLLGRSTRQLPGLLPEIMAGYEPLIQPIDDQRSTASYRKRVALGLIAGFCRGLAGDPFSEPIGGEADAAYDKYRGN